MSSIKELKESLARQFSISREELDKLRRYEEFEASVMMLTTPENFNKVKDSLSNIPTYKQSVFINCLKAGVPVEYCNKAVEKLFSLSTSSPFSAMDIFYVFQQFHRLEELYKD
ncbi:hypothetical protein CMT42_14815 [Elizabethkingia anophelis]|nr:hypothetical protein [Elizabethkingia anophelis]MDV3894524.1 hypothetical protein [Elizabethkingia anophelis]MDV3914533.1 hypothetical protein [Elizabethkingia anophelis]MDV3920719.1 hypothetical protein [Elizabethkingia anophelis]MDV3959194.1 hypothetical protein [Elizabethkingia anophelis]